LFYVFEYEHLRLFRVEYSRYVKKKRPANVLKTAHIADYAERLAREPREKDIEVRYAGGVDFRYVSRGRYAVIRGVRAFGLFVYFARENALPAERARRLMEPADTGE